MGSVGDSYDKDLVSYCTSLRGLGRNTVSQWAALPGDQSRVAFGGDLEERAYRRTGVSAAPCQAFPQLPAIG